MIAPCSSTLYRCGHSYFSLKANERKVQPFDLYPETKANGACDKYRPHGYLAALRQAVV